MAFSFKNAAFCFLTAHFSFRVWTELALVGAQAPAAWGTNLQQRGIRPACALYALTPQRKLCISKVFQKFHRAWWPRKTPRPARLWRRECEVPSLSYLRRHSSFGEAARSASRPVSEGPGSRACSSPPSPRATEEL